MNQFQISNQPNGVSCGYSKPNQPNGVSRGFRVEKTGANVRRLILQ